MDHVNEAEGTSNAGEGLMFARLMPINRNALLAFDSVVEVISTYHGGNHHRKFLSWNPMKSSLDTVEMQVWNHRTKLSRIEGGARRHVTEGEDPNNFWECTDDKDADPDPVAKKEIWHGYYQFNLKTERAHGYQEWSISSGRWPKHKQVASSDTLDDHGGVDIILTRHAGMDRVRGFHALLYYKTDSGLLVIEALREAPYGIYLDGEPVIQSTRALRKSAMVVEFGALQYVFEFTIADEQADALFQQEKIQYFKDHLEAPAPPPTLSATPQRDTDTKMIYRDILMLHSIIMELRNGMAWLASLPDGRLASVMFFYLSDVDSHSKMEAYVKAWKFLAPIADVEDDDRRVTHMEAFGIDCMVNDMAQRPLRWLATSPYCPGTLESMVLQNNCETTRETRLALFKHAIEGLSIIHRSGCVHRNLNPDFVGIVSLRPARATILGIGQVLKLPETGKLPKTMELGSPAFTAPQVQTEDHGTEVDMWSMGWIGYLLFHKPELPWPRDSNP